ncbi:MAG: hypothetical protein MR006_02660 [Arcanobacterium sp.]|nr:hypothetical protein [Arcanobacterium sp.]
MAHDEAELTADSPLASARGMRRIRSFSLRGARLGDKYEQLMTSASGSVVVSVPPGAGVSTIDPSARVDLAEAFGRHAPLIVEVGPGSGEQLVASALAHPERNYLGLEAWAPGVARCAKNVLASGAQNVRIMQLDAAQALPVLFGSGPKAGVAGEEVSAQIAGSGADRSGAEGQTGSDSLASEVWTFFPDPWRKRKHRKRRLVSPAFAQIVAGVLTPGGLWRLATDWANYAWQMRDVLVESPWFELVDTHGCAQENLRGDGGTAQRAVHDEDREDLGLYSGGFVSRWSERVVTRFEERGIEAGRAVYDLVVVRNSVPIDAAEVPLDPWIAAAARGERVRADQPGAVPPPSSRSGWLREQRTVECGGVEHNNSGRNSSECHNSECNNSECAGEYRTAEQRSIAHHAGEQCSAQPLDQQRAQYEAQPNEANRLSAVDRPSETNQLNEVNRPSEANRLSAVDRPSEVNQLLTEGMA